MKTIIEIHALQNFAPSNLNRDDTGAPKDALFGGTHARISSQCSKRAIRQYFLERGYLGPDDVAIRTVRLLEALTKQLVAKGRKEEEAKKKAISALDSVNLKIKKTDKSEYLLFIGQLEVSNIAKVIDEKWDSLSKIVEPDGQGDQEATSKKKADPALKKALEEALNGKAVDIALFGRMLANMPEKNQEAACQVAHALSTHAVEREFDFFTAVDDLRPEDTQGADMMGTVEFNSACFYRYAAVDWGRLVSNLQGDAELALRGLRAFLEGFVVSEPTGKQNTFAAHNAPEFVAVTVRNNAAPRNLANAFETAIRVRGGESLTQKSVEALAKKYKDLQAAYGGEENTFILNLTEANLQGIGKPLSSLQDLIGAALAAVPKQP